MSFLNTQYVTAQQINVNYIQAGLPALKADIARPVLKSGDLTNGVHYDLQLMTLEDAAEISNVLSAAGAKNPDKNYLLPRSLDDIKKTLSYDAALQEGGFVIGIVLNGDQLAGIVGGEDIDNENDSGRGTSYKGCDIKKQFCWKMAGIHPQAAGQGLYDLVPAVRMAVTMEMFPQKTCILTKTNNARVKENYGDMLEWKLKDVYDLKNDSVIPSDAYDPARDDDTLLHTYVTRQEDEIRKLASENWDLIARSEVLQQIYARNSHIPVPA